MILHGGDEYLVSECVVCLVAILLLPWLIYGLPPSKSICGEKVMLRTVGMVVLIVLAACATFWGMLTVFFVLPAPLLLVIAVAVMVLTGRLLRRKA
jgi:cation transport ATPase